MKYENPTCEIVLLDTRDCLTTSTETVTNWEETPIVGIPNY